MIIVILELAESIPVCTTKNEACSADSKVYEHYHFSVVTLSGCEC